MECRGEQLGEGEIGLCDWRRLVDGKPQGIVRHVGLGSSRELGRKGFKCVCKQKGGGGM